jgi:peptidoglycan/LPS O-acetylase OafA/YrhL
MRRRPSRSANFTRQISPLDAGLGYQPHIDGMRAIAVVGVLLLHFGAPISGGFTGVDIFYVISGYLISKSIMTDLAGGSFSFWEFYQRRIRRLFPAFAAVTFIVALVSSFVLLPSQLVAFEKSLIAAATFTSNIYFYGATGYFSPAATTVPLLHYWSLGIEEQFYLVAPLAMVGVYRLKRSWQVACICIATALSLAACIAASHSHPAAAFYLLPFRAFELLLGSLIAFFAGTRKFACTQALADATAALGIVLMIGTMLLIDDSMRYPGTLTLLPCIGAAAVIWAGDRADNAVSLKVLSASPLVFIGKLSYSLYLVHWPIVVFANLLGADVKSASFLAGATVGSIGIAWLIYAWIERPARAIWVLRTPRSLMAFATCATILFVASGAFLIKKDGFSKRRLDRAVAEMLSYQNFDGRPDWRLGTCFIMLDSQTFADLDTRKCAPRAGTDVVLWGSSLVAHYYSGLTPLLHRGIELAQMTAAGCPANLGIDTPSLPNCRSFNDAAFKILMSVKPRLVVLEAQDSTAFDQMLGKITDAGIRAVLLGTTPDYREPVPIILARRIKAASTWEWSDNSILPFKLFEHDRMLSSHFSNMPAVRYVSILGEGCPEARCRLSINKIPLHSDTAHFTRAGSEYYSKFLIDALERELSISKPAFADASHALH